jgi:DNA-binding transcriptional LysR family regulator
VGLGVSLLPTFIVGDDLQSGRLQAVLAEYVPSERNLYALYLPNRHLSAKVRVFIDFLLAKFAPPPYWDRNWRSGSSAGKAAPVDAEAKGTVSAAR